MPFVGSLIGLLSNKLQYWNLRGSYVLKSILFLKNVRKWTSFAKIKNDFVSPHTTNKIKSCQLNFLLPKYSFSFFSVFFLMKSNLTQSLKVINRYLVFMYIIIKMILNLGCHVHQHLNTWNIVSSRTLLVLTCLNLEEKKLWILIY